MLPSGTTVSALSGLTMSGTSLMTSATRLPLAALMVSCTKIMLSIISDMKMLIT